MSWHMYLINNSLDDYTIHSSYITNICIITYDSIIELCFASLIVSKSIRILLRNINICLLRHQHQNQHQTIRHIRTVNQFARSFVSLHFRISYCNLIYAIFARKRLTSYLHWLASIVVVVSSTILTAWSIYLIKHRILLKKWMTIHRLSVFLLCEVYVSNSSLRMCIFRLLIRKFRIFLTQQCSTSSAKVSCSKHFFSLLFLFFSLHFIRNSTTRYLLYQLTFVRLYSTIRTLVAVLHWFALRSLRYQIVRSLFIVDFVS